MLIGICGGLCAGKNSVAHYLVQHQNFSRLSLSKEVSTQALEHQSSHPLGHSVSTDTRFESIDALLNFVTLRWEQRWVTTDIRSESILDLLQRRPFFILLSIDAPLGLRWTRLIQQCKEQNISSPTLEEFVYRNDLHLFGSKAGLAPLIDRAQIRLVNQTSSIETLQETLKALDLTDARRLRPNWDEYFMQLASLASHRSNCMKRRVGCVLVREKRVISTGYNGTPRGLTNCNEGGCLRCNSGSAAGIGLSTCLCIHAEENALLEAGRERIREGAILYCDTCPCLTCSIKIAQVGISEVVYSQEYGMDKATTAVFQAARVTLRQFVPPRKGLVNMGGWQLPTNVLDQ